MTLTTDNYEIYFYQYYEGGLTSEERAEVEAFAAQHPELAEELSLYDPHLTLQEVPIAYPDKERLLHHETKVLSLWRWAAAACVAALLGGGAWLIWPEEATPTTMTTDRVAQLHHTHPQESIEKHGIAQPNISAPTVRQKTPIAPTETSTPNTHEPADSGLDSVQNQVDEILPPSTQPLVEEPALLAEAEEPITPQGEDTLVLQYIDTYLYPDVQLCEVVPTEVKPTLGNRLRAFRSKSINNIRDYSYQTYANARGKFVELAYNYNN